MATNGHAITVSTTETDQSHVASFWARYEHLKMHDVLKNVLLEDVLTRYENLVLKHSVYTSEVEAERALTHTALQREQQALANVSQLQHILNRDPFVLVLLDGDGMIFNDRYLRAGEAGGVKAAAVLHDAVQNWAAANVDGCPAEVKVTVRVYANLSGLAGVCTKAGLVASPSQLEEFARGFTRGKMLFDFVDVGPGKDRADVKVAEALRLFLYDYHCRQILFGCSQDNGYARVLEQYVENAEALQRVTLLEGVPFEKELAVLPYPTAKFPTIFRDTKISIPPVDLFADPAPFRPRIDSRGLNAACEAFTPGRSNTNTPLSSYLPKRLSPIHNLLEPTSSPDSLPQHLRTFSSTSVSSSDASNPPSFSWALVAKSSAARLLSSAPTSSSAATPSNGTSVAKEILRNRAGHRVDEPLDYDREEVIRLKKLKMCNQHYIGGGCCHYNAGKSDKCPHKHEIRVTAQERYLLRVVARETPCKKGLFCDDKKCIYGHRCPFPVATEGSLRGSGRCLNGEHCRFGHEMHGVDSKVVKTVRVTGAF
ncbi:hypothetical protein LTR91_010182 [Friedmanniomyces endolithicus]|uniref:C3H1-type domain-containing protein n=1 Tax=Friedmanniomyces endolithicus TaxID=329885 RepID=A0AAN6FHD2_9PEZI|nr:hypothetical protein LTS09_001677 [Friedmanniomyces endolithicus]KAK0314421.1 hypothetical protein LTR01_001244 [Friedmanniomyces endolithicus]KAK0318302.1 hypothetical protein LTR82_010690 [Friedmanniomyces endolithicus]KAK0827779.1 hypothetical protein LTR73_005381 [Friedmanniomyces endolithicus]KAK0927527.1 hypothetical protein LTR57_003248 [Friedmanniomyces endolithicus]